jgi:plastocyanin
MTTRVFLALLAVVALVGSGCGGSKNSGGGASSTAPSGQQSSASAVVLDVTINNGNVTPTNAELHAKVGQPVVFRVNSDADDELHVHSVPDHEFTVEPNRGQTFQFTVDVPGQVEVELHKLNRTVATIQVQQ